MRKKFKNFLSITNFKKNKKGLEEIVLCVKLFQKISKLMIMIKKDAASKKKVKIAFMFKILSRL